MSVAPEPRTPPKTSAPGGNSAAAAAGPGSGLSPPGTTRLPAGSQQPPHLPLSNACSTPGKIPPTTAPCSGSIDRCAWTLHALPRDRNQERRAPALGEKRRTAAGASMPARQIAWLRKIFSALVKRRGCSLADDKGRRRATSKQSPEMSPAHRPTTGDDRSANNRTEQSSDPGVRMFAAACDDASANATSGRPSPQPVLVDLSGLLDNPDDAFRRDQVAMRVKAEGLDFCGQVPGRQWRVSRQSHGERPAPPTRGPGAPRP